jgi:hypothetical protein
MPSSLGQAPGHRHRLVVRHVRDLVDQRQVEVLGHEARADALDLVRRRLELLAARVWLITGEWIGSTATECSAWPLVARRSATRR